MLKLKIILFVRKLLRLFIYLPIAPPLRFRVINSRVMAAKMLIVKRNWLIKYVFYGRGTKRNNGLPRISKTNLCAATKFRGGDSLSHRLKVDISQFAPTSVRFVVIKLFVVHLRGNLLDFQPKFAIKITTFGWVQI